MVFQDPYSSLNPRQTIGQIIGTPFAIHRTPGSTKSKVQDLMNRVGLNPEHYNRYPHEFSGGQRQRIGVARALALSPKLIVCDEPVSALDVSIQAQILNLLLSLQQDFDLTYLFISHDLGVVRHVSDRIAVMYLGRIVEMGAADEVYSTPEAPLHGGPALGRAEEGERGAPPEPHRPDGRRAVAGRIRRRAVPSIPGARRHGSSRARRTRCPRTAGRRCRSWPRSARHTKPRAGIRSPRPTTSQRSGRVTADYEPRRSILWIWRCSRPSSRATSDTSTTPPGWRRASRGPRAGRRMMARSRLVVSVVGRVSPYLASGR